MDLKKIVAIAGYPEVFKVIKEARKGLIVESLQTGKRMQAFITYKISSLEDIAIFTQDGEIPLKDVFKRIWEKENKGKAPDPKNLSKDEIKNYFEQILPEYDRNKVYVSDMKKVLRWYNMLLDKGILDFEQEEKEQKSEQSTEQQDAPQQTENQQDNSAPQNDNQ